MIDKARAEEMTLYVIAVDLTNAFPSVDRATLWLKLYRMGMRGKIFDWIRMLYAKLEYVVRHNGAQTMSFRSLLGILIGDTMSPELWNLYLADFGLPEDVDDIILFCIRIAHLDQADDILFGSCSARGMQRKLDHFVSWCRANFMIINAIKTYAAIFGPRPRQLPVFTLDGETIAFVTKLPYMGMVFCTEDRNIFADFYDSKAKKSRSIAHQILQIESMIGALPPKEAKVIYMGRLDPHLIYGCEVALDIDLPLLDLLAAVQISFWRRILGVNGHSVIVALFSETSVFPLQFRRLLVVITFLEYGLHQPTDTYVYNAMMDSITLAGNARQSWTMDLQYILHTHCGIDIVPARLSALDRDGYKALRDLIMRAMDRWINSEIQRCSKKLYLLQDRREPQEKGPAVYKPLAFRHYLLVFNPQHRKALTRVLLSAHPLASERLRWTDRYRKYVPPEKRLCRFCVSACETPEHALFDCMAHAVLVVLRTTFLAKLYSDVRTSLPAQHTFQDSAHFLRAVLAQRHVTYMLARFVFEAIEIYESVPLRVPPEYIIRYS
jgi:hypothetical protein